MMEIFCCERMETEALSEDQKWKFIDFDLSKRYFGIFQINTPYSIEIKHCPFCGKKLPDNLIDEKWDTIFSELGKDFLADEDGNPPKKELPPEFKTDEWWKKRGL
jgi:hypothetical protein